MKPEHTPTPSQPAATGTPHHTQKHTPTPHGHPQPHGTQSHLPPSHKKRWWWLIVAALVVFLALSTLVSVTWYKHQLVGRTAVDEYHTVTVVPGSGTAQIAQELEDKKLIKSTVAFKVYTKLHNTSTLQAGTYRLSSKLSTPEIVDILQKGEVTSVDVLIAPGLRLDQIEATLENAGYSQQEITEAFASVRDHPLLQGLPVDTPLEGYLFPETYRIDPTTSAESLIRLMLDTFNKRITPDIRAGIEQQGLSLNQAVIIASIVQKEVPDLETQKKVAQVFIKRYREGMPLGADPTFKYAAAITGLPATPSLDSPYNTRRYAGLPPTPISNFNMSALEAVAYPEETDYLYFVSGDNGTTYFSHTLEEHEALTRQYCHELCHL